MKNRLKTSKLEEYKKVDTHFIIIEMNSKIKVIDVINKSAMLVRIRRSANRIGEI
jgi:hypothetical protein